MNPKIPIRTLQCLVACGALLTLANGVGAAFAAAPVEGKPVPSFSMKTTAGKSVSNQSLRGKVVLLDFWATWCGPCKAASPMVQALHKQYGSKGFVAIGANTFEDGDALQLTKAYATEHKYSYLFTYNNDKLAQSWGITGIPYFVLIDKKGVVQKIYRGYGPSMQADLKSRVSKLLAAK